jgi:multidrug efflux pump subunit AcrB
MYSEFNGHRAVMVDIFRVGDQDVIEIANTVKAYIERSKSTFPEGVELTIWNDWSETIRDRLKTLTGSLLWGGLLVFIILAMFLRFSVAIFVSLGVPVSFLGGLAMMPLFDISLNLLSMFAFIMVLGIVVDDAIVTGENIFNHLRRRKGSSTDAAIAGTHEVSVPVTFGVLTTMIAFVPLMLLPGRRGEFFSVIAIIVIIVLAFSLVQSKLVLPAHMSYLTHIGRKEEKLNWLQRFQRLFSDGLEWFIRKVYRKLLHIAIKYRYSTAAFFLAIFMIMVTLLSTGHLKFFFFPRVESDSVTVRLDMPIGTPVEVTEQYVVQINDAAEAVKAEFNERFGDGTIRNLLMTVGGQPFGGRGGGGSGQSHQGEVILELAPGEVRPPQVSAFSVSQVWRDKVGIVPGGEVSYVFSRASGGAPIDVQLSGPDFQQLDLLANAIKEQLATYPGVVDIADSFESGKDEIKLTLKPAARNLGLTTEDLARQVRQAFFGLEAQRIQRGRDDVRVMVRYPQEERRSIANLENMRIRTPDGQQVPFYEVANAEMGKSLPSIRRVDRNRTLNVTADIEEGEGDVEAVKADLVENFLPALLLRHPEVSFSLEGEAREQRESFESIRFGIMIVLFSIYAMLAIVFRSYLQPFIIMLVIPFSVIGAIAFHMIRGDMLSIMSILGILALIGVVVNDSLVLVDYVNRRRHEGYSLLRAVSKAGVARFRPILLTSLTTIGGLTPLLLEKSRQAQWLIPMAVSLAGGIAFATFLTLFLVPMFYLIFEDIGKAARRTWRWLRG